jgi:hypothetical protein
MLTRGNRLKVMSFYQLNTLHTRVVNENFDQKHLVLHYGTFTSKDEALFAQKVNHRRVCQQSRRQCTNVSEMG